MKLAIVLISIYIYFGPFFLRVWFRIMTKRFDGIYNIIITHAVGYVIH